MKREAKRIVWPGVLVVVLAVSAPAGAQQPLQNGDFDSGLDGWTIEGTVTFQDAGVGGDAAILYEADFRGLSRIYQDFDIPPGAEWLSFTPCHHPAITRRRVPTARAYPRDVAPAYSAWRH